VIVSPYAKPGHVTDTVYDHTSILKLIQRKWNLSPLTRRDAAATDPLDALDLDSPPPFLVPPTLPEPARQWHG
jgi:phospholipase C